MLQNWLKPRSIASIDNLKTLSSSAFGKKIVIHTKNNFPDLRHIKVAIIGIGEKEADEVRRYLYDTQFLFPKDTVADLGNARKTDPSFLIPLIFELLVGKITPIIIGAEIDQITTQFLAYQNTKALLSAVVLDEKMRFSAHKNDLSTENILNQILAPRHPMLFHFSHIGGQSHFISPESIQFFEKNNFDFMRLGRARTSLDEVEPLIRDADSIAFNLSALKLSEAPGQLNASPSGFTCEEACQLARYAGISDKLTSFGIYGFSEKLDRDGQTAQVVSQIIWYFLDGFFNRKNDFPVSSDGLTEYIVDFKDHDWSLTFWKSSKSGRWWMQVPVETQEKHQRHRLIPCSIADYQMACREELPERLFNAFQRFA
jgi:formiminoglutamase